MLGDRLNPRKTDLHRWRESFAEKLRGYGIEAEASRQATRGVLRNADPLWRFKTRNEGRLQEIPAPEKRGKQAVLSRKAALEAWGRIADALSASETADDRKLAADIRGFVHRQPVVQAVLRQRQRD